MEVIVNGEPKIFDNKINIQTLMEALGYEKGVGAVAINMTFVASDKYEETILHDGDEVEILAPVCGG
jgi:sulfur carrier protein